jgi:hypothetical protein
MGIERFSNTPDRIIATIIKKRLSRNAACHGGTLGERRYSSYSFLTWALEEGEWSASCPSHALPPGKEPLVPLCRRLGGPQNPCGCRD